MRDTGHQNSRLQAMKFEKRTMKLPCLAHYVELLVFHEKLVKIHTRVYIHVYKVQRRIKVNFFARGVAKIKENSRELSNSGNSDILARSDACFNPREDRGNSLKTRLHEVFKVTLICFSPFKILNLSYEIFFFFFFGFLDNPRHIRECSPRNGPRVFLPGINYDVASFSSFSLSLSSYISASFFLDKR